MVYPYFIPCAVIFELVTQIENPKTRKGLLSQERDKRSRYGCVILDIRGIVDLGVWIVADLVACSTRQI